MRLSYLLIFISFAFQSMAGIGLPTYESDGDLYIISVGVDDYLTHEFAIKYTSCASDALLFSDKATKDFYNYPVSFYGEQGSVKSYLLQEEQATYENIKEVFKQVAKEAKEEDEFLFFFAGISAQIHNESALFTYNKDTTLEEYPSIGMAQLAEWMENIAAKNQLIISEAGPGSEFALDLITNLFETNPYIAEQNDRNRIILTTRGMGLEARKCREWHGGYLLKYMHNSMNLLSIFYRPEQYEYAIMKEEMKCEPSNYGQLYSAMFQESTYKWLLTEQFMKATSRTVVTEDLDEVVTEVDSNKHIPKDYALIISTNDYRNGRPSWPDLSNPKRDADAVGELLQDKYGFELVRIHNKTKNEVLQRVKEFKTSLHVTDKVVVFIAGHGLYDEDFNSSYLVFTDGHPVNQSVDESHQSYLNMSTLYNILTSAESQQMFLILDVCFGGYFDLMAPDIILSSYKELELDMSLEEWIERNDTSHRSRIFLASGTGEVPDYWNNSLNHSPFASKLIKALKKETQFISPGKILNYMHGNITEPVLKDFSNRHRTDDTRADFLMAVKPKSVTR